MADKRFLQLVVLMFVHVFVCLFVCPCVNCCDPARVMQGEAGLSWCRIHWPIARATAALQGTQTEICLFQRHQCIFSPGLNS